MPITSLVTRSKSVLCFKRLCWKKVNLDPAGLDYLNARYYDSSRGQFLTEDPVFWGNPKNQTLANPQGLNSYSYSIDNPITGKDPSGLLRQQSAVNITRNLLADLISFSNNLAAYVNGLTHNPSQALENVASAATSPVPSPFVVGRNVVSNAAGDASRTWNMINSGDDNQQERGITNLIEFEGSAIAPAAGVEAAAPEVVPQVLMNRAAGNAFRDSVAATMRQAGYDVQTEVYKPTGLGARYIDIDVSKNGVNLGGIETKVGSSPYTTGQRAKDAWLRWTNGYIVNVIRNRQ